MRIPSANYTNFTAPSAAASPSTATPDGAAAPSGPDKASLSALANLTQADAAQHQGKVAQLSAVVGSDQYSVKTELVSNAIVSEALRQSSFR